MNKQMQATLQRRSELLAQIAEQRGQVAEIGARWQTPLALVSQCLAVMRFLRSRPLLVGGVAAVLIIRRRGLMGLARSGWLVWKGYRYFAALSAGLLSGKP